MYGGVPEERPKNPIPGESWCIDRPLFGRVRIGPVWGAPKDQGRVARPSAPGRARPPRKDPSRGGPSGRARAAVGPRGRSVRGRSLSTEHSTINRPMGSSSPPGLGVSRRAPRSVQLDSCARPSMASLIATDVAAGYGPGAVRQREQHPVFILPMLLTSGPVPAGGGWTFEAKWDGCRAQLRYDGRASRCEPAPVASARTIFGAGSHPGGAWRASGDARRRAGVPAQRLGGRTFCRSAGASRAAPGTASRSCFSCSTSCISTVGRLARCPTGTGGRCSTSSRLTASRGERRRASSSSNPRSSSLASQGSASRASSPSVSTRRTARGDAARPGSSISFGVRSRSR